MITAPAKGSATASFDALDRQIDRLRARRKDWVHLEVRDKVGYLHRAIERLRSVATRQAAAAARAKGVDPRSPAAAEDLISGPYITIRTMRLLAETLSDYDRHGRFRLPRRAARRLPNGRIAASVFPMSSLDRALYMGFSAEVWMDSSVTELDLANARGRIYREGTDGGVALVLGAGNVASIGPLDAVYKLFADGEVVVLKLNPVNDYLGPFIEDAFADLIADGFLATAYGGADVGAYLCEHPGIDSIHITGSAATHDTIVYGPGTEGEAAKRSGTPRLDKPITSELGNVSPIIIVPGAWKARDLDFHAENIATQMTQNCGFNCNATQVIVTHESWPQRDDLLDRLESVLAELPARPAYYPGAHERYDRYLEAYPDAVTCGKRADGALPTALVRDLPPDSDRDLAFRTESFCAFAVETPIAASTPGQFLEEAVDFCNERLYGTLNAGLIAGPTERSSLAGEIDSAVGQLRYGSVAINHWPAISYGLGTTTWGAFPGHTLDDIGSGIGVVHNALLFDRPEKSVVEGPFHVLPKPAWFVTHGNPFAVAERLVELEADPSLLRVPRIFLNALFG